MTIQNISFFSVFYFFCTTALVSGSTHAWADAPAFECIDGDRSFVVYREVGGQYSAELTTFSRNPRSKRTYFTYQLDCKTEGKKKDHYSCSSATFIVKSFYVFANQGMVAKLGVVTESWNGLDKKDSMFLGYLHCEK